LDYDEFYVQEKEELHKAHECKKYEGYRLREYDLPMYKDKLYILNNVDLKKIMMDELHQSPYSVHLGY